MAHPVTKQQSAPDTLCVLRSALKTTTCDFMRQHIRMAIASHVDEPSHLLPRDFDQLAQLGVAPYTSANPLSFLIKNGHGGQRKLCLAMIEFLSNVHSHRIRTGQSGPLLVVYAGSSIMAAIAGCDAFPGTKFVCFDPAWRMTIPVLYRESGSRAAFIMGHRVRTMKHLSVNSIHAALENHDVVFLTDHAGKFSDATCEPMLALHSQMQGYDLAFVSDVRSVARQTPAQKEITISADMASQARWVKMLDVSYYSLKLRLPFTMTPEIYQRYVSVCSLFGEVDENNSTRGNKLPYISGRCVLQKYARNMSTEMRLMGVSKPSVKWYDICDIETTFFPFNTVHRGNTKFMVHPTIDDESTTSLEQHVLRHARNISSHGAHASFDELGEALVLGEAACITAKLQNPETNPSTAFNRVVRDFCSMFEGRLGRV